MPRISSLQLHSSPARQQDEPSPLRRTRVGIASFTCRITVGGHSLLLGSLWIRQTCSLVFASRWKGRRIPGRVASPRVTPAPFGTTRSRRRLPSRPAADAAFFRASLSLLRPLSCHPASFCAWFSTAQGDGKQTTSDVVADSLCRDLGK